MTTLTNSIGTVDLSHPELDSAVSPAICLSSGVDSAVLLYHFFKANQDTDKTFKVITGNDILRPWWLSGAQNTLAAITALFDRNIVSEHIVFDFNSGDGNDAYIAGLAKKFLDDTIDFAITGRCGNPPKDYQGDFHQHLDSFPARNIVLPRYSNNGIFIDEEGEPTRDPYNPSGKFAKVFSPFVVVDKRWIAQEVKGNNLDSDVFPLTVSCHGYQSQTSNFTSPCGVCWYCREKIWAYGCADGGTPTIF